MALRQRAVAAVATSVFAATICTGGGLAAASTASWHVVSGPIAGARALDGVSAVDTTHAYAVGTQYPTSDPAAGHAVVEAWDGSSWHDLVSQPDASQLTSISAVSPSDIWVAGYRTAESVATLVWHYDGAAWTATTSRGLPVMTTATVFSAGSHVWLAGEVDPGRRDTGAVIASYHASGTPHWSVDRLSRVGGFYGAAVRTGTDAWAVGGTSQYAGHGHAVVAHWNGRSWKLSTLSIAGSFTTVAIAGPSDVMAAGEKGSPSYEPLGMAAHWNGHRWISQHFKQPARNVFDSLAAYGKHSYVANRSGVSYAEYRAHYTRYAGGHWRAEVGAHQPAPTHFVQNPKMWLARVPGTSRVLSVGWSVLYSSTNPGSSVSRSFPLREIRT